MGRNRRVGSGCCLKLASSREAMISHCPPDRNFFYSLCHAASKCDRFHLHDASKLLLFYPVGGMGILVKYLGGTGILPVINIPSQAGCPPYSYSCRLSYQGFCQRYKPKKKPAPQCHWGSKLLSSQPSVSSTTQPSATNARQARPCQVTENELVAQVARKFIQANRPPSETKKGF
ncbi:MAG: hypothetical protein F6J98_25320 [Moorea sp. SIO4G2]|nr:hypothetical protein [Moorena sp. SIO4G2]